MNCDECKWYKWYFDWCEKWKCEMDARSVQNCFEPRETPIRKAMVDGGMKDVY